MQKLIFKQMTPTTILSKRGSGGGGGGGGGGHYPPQSYKKLCVKYELHFMLLFCSTEMYISIKNGFKI